MPITFPHCKNSRRVHKRWDIRLPHDTEKYRFGQFETVTVYRLICPVCLQRGVHGGYFYCWRGNYLNQDRRQEIQKIDRKDEPLWLEWVKDLKITEDIKGSDKVESSQKQYPHRFLPSVPVY